jgi:large subunit ribosomal protein L17
MRHQRSGKQLSRTAEHRKALLRNLVTELFRHERIETTTAKAKEARSVAEKLITFAKRGDLHARRRVDSYVMSPEVTRKLFGTIAGWYADRPGGYTRIIRTRARLGDGAEMAYLELVKSAAQIAAERKAREAELEAKTEGKGDKKTKATAKPKAEKPKAEPKAAKEKTAKKKTAKKKTAKKKTAAKKTAAKKTAKKTRRKV